MMGGGGGGDSTAARAAEFARQTRVNDGINSINKTFDQFGDDFYTGRRDAFLDYATPQLNDQYADARKQLIFSLDRNGTLDSTVRTSKEADLSKLYDTNKRAVNDQALSYENDARNNVAGAKTDLINQIVSTGDSAGAVNAANSRAAALSQPDAYSPLSQLFSTFTGALNTQAGLERAATYTNGAIKPLFNTGLFGGNSAVKVY